MWTGWCAELWSRKQYSTALRGRVGKMSNSRRDIENQMFLALSHSWLEPNSVRPIKYYDVMNSAAAQLTIGRWDHPRKLRIEVYANADIHFALEWDNLCDKLFTLVDIRTSLWFVLIAVCCVSTEFFLFTFALFVFLHRVHAFISVFMIWI